MSESLCSKEWHGHEHLEVRRSSELQLVRNACYKYYESLLVWRLMNMQGSRGAMQSRRNYPRGHDLSTFFPTREVSLFQIHTYDKAIKLNVLFENVIHYHRKNDLLCYSFVYIIHLHSILIMSLLYLSYGFFFFQHIFLISLLFSEWMKWNHGN